MIKRSMQDGLATRTASEVFQINLEVEEELAEHMLNKFVWHKATQNRPDMSADEIASAAADGFKVSE